MPADHRRGGGRRGVMFTQLLDTVGDGTGTMNMGTTAATYKIAPPNNETWLIERILVSIFDVTKLTALGFGSLSVLNNGIVVRCADDNGVVNDLTNGVPIIHTEDWTRYCHDTALDLSSGGKDYTSYRWTFGRSGSPLIVSGVNNGRLEVVIQDDLSNLDGLYVCAQGTR